jgi:hypothetical protein
MSPVQIAISSAMMFLNNQFGCKMKLSGEYDMSRIEISNLNSEASFLTDLSATETTNIVGGSSGKKGKEGYGGYGYENEGRGKNEGRGNYGNDGHGNYGNYGSGYGHGYGHGGDCD